MKLMRVDTQLGDNFEAGIPEPMFDVRLRPIITRNRYSFSPDGKRLLILGTLKEHTTPPTTIVLNWAAELSP